MIATYAPHQEIPRPRWDTREWARGSAELDAAITDDTACVLIQSPNFFGTIEDVAAIAAMAHAKGALLIVSIAEAVSLGIVSAAERGGYCFAGGAEFWGGVGLWRALLRRDCVQGEVSAADAGAVVGETKDMNGKRGGC